MGPKRPGRVERPERQFPSGLDIEPQPKTRNSLVTRPTRVGEWSNRVTPIVVGPLQVKTELLASPCILLRLKPPSPISNAEQTPHLGQHVGEASATPRAAERLRHG